MHYGIRSALDRESLKRRGAKPSQARPGQASVKEKFEWRGSLQRHEKKPVGSLAPRLLRSPRRPRTHGSQKGVAINLSQPRRESLKAFADTSGKAMSPAQALYTLIDRIKPAAASGLPPDISAGQGQECSASVREGDSSSLIAQRLSSIETDARDTRDALMSCAAALEDISNAMAPIRDLIASLSRASAPPTSTATSPSLRAAFPSKAVDLKEWLAAVADITGLSPRKEVAFALRLAERPRTLGDRVQMAFKTTIFGADKRSTEAPIPLPMLALSADAGGALVVCLSVEPRAELRMVLTQAPAGAWRASVSLKTGPSAYGRVLFEAAP